MSRSSTYWQRGVSEEHVQWIMDTFRRWMATISSYPVDMTVQVAKDSPSSKVKKKSGDDFYSGSRRRRG